MSMTNEPFGLHGKRVFVAGHHGMVGSGLVRALARWRDCDVLTAGRDTMDLCDQTQVRRWFDENRPEAVFLAAAKVGGILANDTYPADFLYQNLMIEANVIEAAFRSGVEKLLFLGSSCIYPKLAEQPIAESSLLTGPLEPTNEWYAVAKIAGIKLCQAYRKQHGCNFISAMPTNLYGPNDNFDLASSHVLPALMRKIHEGRLGNRDTVEIWGSGNPRREFMHVDDLADACIYLMENYAEPDHINVGVSEDITIRDLAGLIADVVEYKGRFAFDSSKPDGTPRKLMDSSRLLGLGWQPKLSLADGLGQTYRWFLDNPHRG